MQLETCLLVSWNQGATVGKISNKDAEDGDNLLNISSRLEWHADYAKKSSFFDINEKKRHLK